MAVMYLLLAGAASGGMFWLPKAVSATLGASSQLMVGWLVGLPYLAFALSGVLWGRSSDRRNERRWHMSIASVICGSGLLLAGVSDSVIEMVMEILIFNIGFAGSFAVAWNLVTVVIRKDLLAIGVAFVSSAGAVGSFLCVTGFGVAIEKGVSYSVCFDVLCGLLVMAAICSLLSRDPGSSGRTLLDVGR
jgi:MFS family permease